MPNNQNAFIHGRTVDWDVVTDRFYGRSDGASLRTLFDSCMCRDARSLEGLYAYLLTVLVLSQLLVTIPRCVAEPRCVAGGQMADSSSPL